MKEQVNEFRRLVRKTLRENFDINEISDSQINRWEKSMYGHDPRSPYFEGGDGPDDEETNYVKLDGVNVDGFPDYQYDTQYGSGHVSLWEFYKNFLGYDLTNGLEDTGDEELYQAMASAYNEASEDWDYSKLTAILYHFVSKKDPRNKYATPEDLVNGMLRDGAIGISSKDDRNYESRGSDGPDGDY